MNTELEPEVVDAIQRGKKIEAIKRLREIRNIGLKESKDLVDDYVNHNGISDSDNNTNHKSIEKLSSNNGLIVIIIIGAILYMAYEYFN